MFDEDKDAVLKELHGLPRTSLLRKINALVARVRRVRAHICVLDHIRSQLPWMSRAMGAHSIRRWLGENLPRLVEDARRARGLSPGDLPNFESFRARMVAFQVERLVNLPQLTERELARLDRVINADVPALIGSVGVGGVTSLEVSCRETSPPPPPRGFLCGKRKRAAEEE